MDSFDTLQLLLALFHAWASIDQPIGCLTGLMKAITI
jgi:hypothetical protein